MIGKKISHYHILEKLGGGGMGIVYKAEDTKLNRTVALKFLPPELTRNPEAKQRFFHEARAASALQHTNICTIHEIDETGDGQLFMVMDFYDGKSLRDKIKDERLKIKEVIDCAIMIAKGLANAHEKGIIHRDIKPANIFITGDGEIKVLDFGLAKLSAARTRLTREGTTLGTVAYMSPEQAKGEAVDHRTDIWSLGVVLYEMLAGTLPFRGEYEQGVIYSIINETPEPITAVRTGVPLELERLVEKCLAKDPRERYQHMDELIVDLNRVKKEPELRSGVSETEHGKEVPAKERKNLIRLFTGILLAGIVVAGGYFIISGIVKKESVEGIKSIAILPFDDLSPARDQEYFCDGMTEQLTTNLSRLQNLQVRGRNSVMQFRNSDKTIPRIARELKVDYILEGSIRKDDRRLRVTVQLIKGEDDYHLWAQDYDRQLDDMFDVQDDIAGTVTEILLTKLSADEKKKIKTHKPVNKEAYEYLMKGKYYHSRKFLMTYDTEDFAAAEKMLLKAVELDPDYAEAYVELADLYNSYYFMKAKTDDEKARYMMLQEQFLRQASLLDSGSAEFNRVRGSFYAAKNELEKVYFYLKRSVELDNRNPANNQQFGYFFNTIGLYEQAIKYCLRAIEIDPLDLYSYTEIINSYWNADQLDQAEIYCRKSLEIDPGDAYIHFIYARILYDMKQYDRFEETRLKVENMDADPVHIKYLRSLHYILQGEKEKALSAWDKPYQAGLSGFLFRRVCDHFRMNDEFIQYLHEEFELLKKYQESHYLWLRSAALYDNLRSDPRFQELLEKHRLVYEENLRKYPDIGD